MNVQVKIKLYDLVSDAVERGASYGWRRAFKNTDKPQDDDAIETIANAVMQELCELIEFHPENES